MGFLDFAWRSRTKRLLASSRFKPGNVTVSGEPSGADAHKESEPAVRGST